MSRPEFRSIVLEGVIGAGKTGMDACVHLLDRGIAPEAVTWIKPQDMWLYNRAYYQPAEHMLDQYLEGMAAQMEIAASAGSSGEMLLRLEEAGVLMRIDRDVTPSAGSRPGGWRSTAPC